MYSLSITYILSLLLLLIVVGWTYKTINSWLTEQNIGKSLSKEVVESSKPHFFWSFIIVFYLFVQVQPNQNSLFESSKYTALHPKFRQLWFGPIVSYLVLYHPHVVQLLLSTAEPKDNVAYRFIRPWIGDGLLVSSGKKWHRNRHLLTRAFHFDVLKEYVNVFNGCADIILKKWEAIGDGIPVEIFGDVSLLTLDSMLKCTMSCDTGCQNQGSEHKYTSAVSSLTTILTKRVFNPFCHSDFIFYLTPNGRKFKAACDYIHQYDEQIIRERKLDLKQLLKHEGDNDNEQLNTDDIGRVAEIRRKNGKCLDFLDILLLTRDEDGKGLSDREIRDEVDTFLFEGHDTTASGISWALYCLAIYSVEQEKCRREILEVVGRKQEIEWIDLSKLVYLSMFIKEVLRLYPPVFIIGRRLQNPITFPRGFGEDQFCLDDQPNNPNSCSRTMPPGHNTAVSIYTLHRNENLWEDAAVFDPTRFEKGKSDSRSPFAHVPFSAGPRNCIGQNFALNEMKVILSKILMHYRLYVDKDCPKPEMMPTIVLKSAKGIYLKLEKLL